MKELVSVIIPTFGKPSGLKRAVLSALKQSYPQIEIIVVDDNNSNSEERVLTEKLMNEIKCEQIHYIKHSSNRNGAAARNTGIGAAHGKYICFLDSDDYYLSDRVSDAVCYLEEHPEKYAVCCDVAIVSNSCLKEIYKMHESDDFCVGLLKNTSLLGTGSNIFIKRTALNTLSGFDEAFQRYQDVEFMLRLSKSYDVGVIHKLDIVKVNCGMHLLDYMKLRYATDFFIDKFIDMISDLPAQEQADFYDDRNSKLFRAAVLSGNAEYLKESAERITKIRELSDSEKRQIEKRKTIRVKYKLKEKSIEFLFRTQMLHMLKHFSDEKKYKAIPPEKANEIKAGI